MKLSIQVGSTSQTVNVFIQDSSSTTGAGLTGLAFNSASLTAYYALPKAAAVAITLATQTVTGAWSSGGFVEISSANMPGWYRLDVPDAAIASGRFSCLHLKGATNMAPLPIEIELTAWNNQDATAGGLSRLDAAVTTRMATYTQPTGFLAATFPTGTVANTTNITSATGIDVTKWLGGTIPAVNVTGVPLVDLKYTLGTISPAAAGSVRADAVTGAVGSVTGAVGSVTGAVGSVTGNVGGNVTGSVGSVVGAVGSVTGNVGGNVVGSVAGAVGSVVAAVAITSNIKKNQALAGFEFLMTDSTNHAPLTLATVTVTRSIDGAAFAAGTLSAVSEVSNGMYSVDFGAADLNGKTIVLRATAVGADDTFERIVTQP